MLTADNNWLSLSTTLCCQQDQIESVSYKQTTPLYTRSVYPISPIGLCPPHSFLTTRCYYDRACRGSSAWMIRSNNNSSSNYSAPVCVRSIVINLSVCLSVYLSVRERISETAGPIFTKCFVQISCGRGSVLLRRRCDTGADCLWMPCYSAPVWKWSIAISLSVCLSVCLCLSVREYIFETAGPIFTKFVEQILCGRDSVILWRRCYMLYTSGFMDDVTFGRSGPYGDQWLAALRYQGEAWCLWMLILNIAMF